jgi:hypothetical protein
MRKVLALALFGRFLLEPNSLSDRLSASADYESASARASSPEALTKPPDMQQAPKPHGAAQTRRRSIQIAYYQRHGLCSSKRTEALPASSTALTGRQCKATHVTQIEEIGSS